jgi:hypothetical protein
MRLRERLHHAESSDPSVCLGRIGVGYSEIEVFLWVTRPGKDTKSYGKSPFYIGKSTINGSFQ